MNFEDAKSTIFEKLRMKITHTFAFELDYA